MNCLPAAVTRCPVVSIRMTTTDIPVEAILIAASSEGTHKLYSSPSIHKIVHHGA